MVLEVSMVFSGLYVTISSSFLQNVVTTGTCLPGDTREVDDDLNQFLVGIPISLTPRLNFLASFRQQLFDIKTLPSLHYWHQLTNKKVFQNPGYTA